MTEFKKRSSSYTRNTSDVSLSYSHSDTEDSVRDTSLDKIVDKLPSFISTNHNNNNNSNISSSVSNNANNIKPTSFYINENSSSSTLLPLQNIASNVEFNNVRTSMDIQDRDSYNLTNTNTNTSTVRPLHHSGSSSTLSMLSRDNMLSKLKKMTLKTDKLTKDNSSTISGSSSSTGANSGSTKGSSGNSNSISSGFTSKMKKPVDLSIQTNMMIPNSAKVDRSSPLTRSSKEIERIASNLTKPSSNLSQSKSKHKHHYHNILRSRKDPIKSSTYSNSQRDIENGGEAMYSFQMSSNEDLPVNEFLRRLNFNDANLNLDEEGIADDAWVLFCSLVAPIFKSERLRTPIEKLNTLLYLHIRLTKKKPKSQQQSISNLSSPIKSPLMSASGPYTPITGMHAPGFVSNNFQSSPTSMGALTPVLGSSTSTLLEEVQEFLKVGLSFFVSQLDFDDKDNKYKMKSSDSASVKRNRSFSVSSSISGLTSNSSLLPISFESKAAFLWDQFYNEIFYYLEGIFLPLDAELEEQQQEKSQSSQPPPSATYQQFPEENNQFTRFSNLSSGSLNISQPSNRKIHVHNLLLTSFRDNVIIPLYEQDRKIDSEYERKRDSNREFSMSAINLGNPPISQLNNYSQSPNNKIGNQVKNVEISINEELEQVMNLIQCFTILASVQTNDTNQKIIENLMQQTREKRSILAASLL